MVEYDVKVEVENARHPKTITLMARSEEHALKQARDMGLKPLSAVCEDYSMAAELPSSLIRILIGVVIPFISMVLALGTFVSHRDMPYLWQSWLTGSIIGWALWLLLIFFG